MRPASPNIVLETLAALKRTGTLWLDEDDFAALIQGFAAASGWEWNSPRLKRLLRDGRVLLEGHGWVRRFEWDTAAVPGALHVEEAA